jgi:hypothetical protein
VQVVHFILEGQSVETLDQVRYRAVVQHLRRLDPSGATWRQVDLLGQGGEVDSTALLEELDQIARAGVPESVAPMLGNIRNDVLRSLRAQGKLGPTE